VETKDGTRRVKTAQAGDTILQKARAKKASTLEPVGSNQSHSEDERGESLHNGRGHARWAKHRKLQRGAM